MHFRAPIGRHLSSGQHYRIHIYKGAQTSRVELGMIEILGSPLFYVTWDTDLSMDKKENI